MVAVIRLIANSDNRRPSVFENVPLVKSVTASWK
jgi:hypothetical protein